MCALVQTTCPVDPDGPRGHNVEMPIAEVSLWSRRDGVLLISFLCPFCQVTVFKEPTERGAQLLARAGIEVKRMVPIPEMSEAHPYPPLRTEDELALHNVLESGRMNFGDPAL